MYPPNKHNPVRSAQCEECRSITGERAICTPRPGLVEGHSWALGLHYGESRSLCKATILPAGDGAEESPRPVTRQRHKRHAALDRVSVAPLLELTSCGRLPTRLHK